MKSALKLLSPFLSILISSCAHNVIVGEDCVLNGSATSICTAIPYKEQGEPYHKPLSEMNNYLCFPPDTWADIENKQAELEATQCE